MSRNWEVIAVYRNKAGDVARIVTVAGLAAGWRALTHDAARVVAPKFDYHAGRQIRVREEGDTSIGEPYQP